MTHINDIMYVLNSFYTYEYSFKSMSGKMITEFIHCILKERLNEDAGYSPKEIKVQQIHNLERFDKYGCEEENVSMRILKTDNIQRGTLL